jgi:hypothetical protein
MSDTIKPDKYKHGRSWKGLLFWNLELLRSSLMIRKTGRDLRWYGICIPKTQWGIGIIVSIKIKN